MARGLTLLIHITGPDSYHPERHISVSGPTRPLMWPGNDPYLIREVGTKEDQQTSFRGELNPS